MQKNRKKKNFTYPIGSLHFVRLSIMAIPTWYKLERTCYMSNCSICIHLSRESGSPPAFLLSFLFNPPTGHGLGLLVYTDHLFSGKQRFFFLTFASGFGSFTVSYLIGVHLHSLIQQSHKSRESEGTEKKDCITQCAELLILNKTWDTLRKMQNSFFSLSQRMNATVHS